MSTFVVGYTYTHSVTFVTDKMLMAIKEIIRCSGLSPEKLAFHWKTLQGGINTWLNSRDLEAVVLEVFDPKTDALVGAWDFDIFYGTAGDCGMWVNTDDIKYHILKAGKWPSDCDYRIVLTTKNGRPNVEGFSATTLRSRDGFVRQSLGTTIDGNGLKTGTAYWRASK
jgi:hypothetical protein